MAFVLVARNCAHCNGNTSFIVRSEKLFVKTLPAGYMYSCRNMHNFRQQLHTSDLRNEKLFLDFLLRH